MNIRQFHFGLILWLCFSYANPALSAGVYANWMVSGTIMADGSIGDILKDDKKIKLLTEAAFKSVDANTNGSLEKNELEKAMIKAAADAGVNPPTDKEVEDVLRDFDKNNDSQLSLDEFEAFIRQTIAAMAKAGA